MACATSQGRFRDGQDTSAYVAPACAGEPPSSWEVGHAEPSGPLDSIVLWRRPVRPPLSVGVAHRTLVLVS